MKVNLTADSQEAMFTMDTLTYIYIYYVYIAYRGKEATPRKNSNVKRVQK